MAGDRDDRRALAGAATDRLVDALDAVLGERLRAAPGVRPDPYADGVVVNPFGLLERCPRRAALPADDFEQTAATARRRVGLAALRRLEDDASAARHVAAAVDEVLTERTDLSRSLADWVEQQDRAGRAAVAAAAITWCGSVLRTVGRDPATRWADASSASRWNVPERVVAVTASHDARRGTVASGERLLLVADGTGAATDRLRAGYVALVRALQSQHAPTRVTLASPARGQMVRVPVDAALLELAVDRVAEHVALRADPESAATAVGRGCAHCHLLELCPEGRAHLVGAG